MSDRNIFGGGNAANLYTPMSELEQEVLVRLVESGDVSQVALAFAIGAALMTVAGIVAILTAVQAERRSLEEIAAPLTSSPSPGTSQAAAAD